MTTLHESAGHDLAFLLRFHDGKAFRAWFDRCWATDFAHGSALTELITNDPDVVVTSRRMLDAATKEEWIVRGKLAPTVSQKFFDRYDDLKHHRDYMADCYGYAPNRDSEAARAFLFGDGNPWRR